jgi:hypothetical protein
MATPDTRRDALHALHKDGKPRLSETMAAALARLHGRCDDQKKARATKRQGAPHWADPSRDAWT